MNILDDKLLPLYLFSVILTILVRCLVKGPNLGEERGELHFGKLRDSQARRRSKWNDREETGAGRYWEEGRVETQRQSDKQVRQLGRYQASGETRWRTKMRGISETANKKPRRK